MSKPEFGVKCVCEGCGERFYDLNRSPVICFKCGVQQSPLKPRMYRAVRVPADRGAFSRRPAPVAVEAKLEPADDIEAAEIPDEDDAALDDDAEDEVEVDIEIDPDETEAVV